MEFSGLLFLYFILPLVVLGYFLLPDVGRRNIFLIIIGFVLFGLCQPLYVPVLLLLIRLNFKWALKIRKGKKKTLVIPILANLSVLFLLRYLDPVLMLAGIGSETGGVLLGLVGNVITWLNQHGFALQMPNWLAPIGFAFFILSAISYLIDVYQGKHPAEKVFRNFVLYMMLFPKLFMGPLVRYEDIRVQIQERRTNYKMLLDGAMRFATGLGKKVLIADFLGRFMLEMTQSGSTGALFGAWLYPLLMLFRIYFDFSAACDMAVGLGKIFGFKIPENFRRPFMAMSVTDFFEGWNLTVRAFFTDYVFLPLCSHKRAKGNRLVGAFAAIMLMSLWHGGSFNFLLLGIFICGVMFIELQFQDFLTDLPYWLRYVLTYLCLIFVAVLFVNRDSASIAAALKAMIGNGGAVVYKDGTRFLNAIPLVGLCWLGVSDEPRKFRTKWKTLCGMTKLAKGPVHPVMPKVYAVSCVLYILGILWLCTLCRVAAPMVESVFMRF